MTERLLMVWPEFPPEVGGMQVHGLACARWFQASGVETLVVTNRLPGARGHEARELDEEFDVPVLRVLARADFVESLALLKQCTRAFRPTRVFASQIAFAPAFDDVPFYARSAGNDVLRAWVGPEDVSFKAMKQLSPEERAGRLRANTDWVRGAAERCAGILCNSSWTKNRLAELGIGKTTVVLGGVDTERFQPVDRQAVREQIGWDCQAEIVVCAGRLVVKKNIDLAIGALAQLPDVEMKIIGDGPARDSLESVAYASGVAERVSFLGSVPHALLPRLIAASDLLWMPSRDAYDPRRFAFDYETMGRSACEAAACGTPAVVSDRGGLPEVVRHCETGLVAPAQDVEQQLACVRRLLDEPELYSRCAALARERSCDKLAFNIISKNTTKAIGLRS